ncbi:MAG: DUF2341 domain-containing protein, partial [Thermoplasmata archaeon]|nr:DUF2341 domain-containing protein [Thermoplasmata archaeon]
LISITDPNLANYAQIDGDDIVFTNAANDTQLPHKIEYWNKTTGVLVACVNVTDITNVSSINMYYDNPSAINSENPEGVWDSNFLMVHHLQETDIDGGAGDIIDDTSNNNDGTTYNMTGDNQVPGMIDGAFDYDGINEYLIVNAFSDDMVTTKAYTISYVLNTTQSDVTWTSRHIAIYNDALTDGFATTHTSDGKIFVYTSGGSTLTESTAGTAINDGEPHLITAIFDQPNDIVSIYVDGELDYQVTSYTDNSAMTDTKIYIAISPAYEVGYEGIFDEIRISDIGRSAEWIRTGYNNTKYPELFIDVGAEQSTPTAEPNITSWQNSKTINNILDFTLNTSERVNFNVTANQSIASWNWDKNDVNQLHNYNNMSTSFQTTGLHIVTVNVTNINGTSNSIQWNVTVNNHDSWSHWKEITINDTMVDQTIGDVHFPLLVHITDTDLRDEAQANGYDIVFTNTEDTEQYAHQIEGNFNSTTGELKARVHIQDISNVSSIRMWYGNSGATNTEDKAGTWGENASGIWLFDEGEGSYLNDSSGNDNNGTIYGADWVDDELNFVSTNSDYVDCGNDSSVHITTDISIEAHINATSWISEANIISFSNGGETSDVNSFYGFVVVNDPGDILLGHEYNDGVNQYHVFNTNLAVDTDYRLYAVRDSTAKTWTLYIDGEQFDSAYTYTNNPTGGENNLLLMGKTPYTVDPLFFDGKIKDVSVFDIVHSASYISTIYNNSAYPALFISLGDEQGIPPDPINLLNTTGKFWVNYTWSPGSGTITDSYNVSYNATWDNSSSNTYRNESVGAHGYLDIIVYAYNISTNALSAGYVTDNVTVPNNVPVLSDVSASYNLYENETFYIDANHTDYDGDTITYIDNASEWDINSATGEVSWVLDWEDVADSPYSYRITIDDGYGGTDYQDFTVTINGMQNTALTSVDTTFETGTPGTDFTANTITLSFYLVNSGSIDADISAKFTSNYETTYGLVSGTSTIGGSNFKLGNATLDALLDNGNSVDLTDNVPGEDTQRNYEVQLRVPAGQDALSYSGAIELTFSDV